MLRHRARSRHLKYGRFPCRVIGSGVHAVIINIQQTHHSIFITQWYSPPCRCTFFDTAVSSLQLNPTFPYPPPPRAQKYCIFFLHPRAVPVFVLLTFIMTRHRSAPPQYISEACIGRLKEHQYSVVGKSIIEAYLQPFWTWVVELFPTVSKKKRLRELNDRIERCLRALTLGMHTRCTICGRDATAKKKTHSVSCGFLMTLPWAFLCFFAICHVYIIDFLLS